MAKKTTRKALRIDEKETPPATQKRQAKALETEAVPTTSGLVPLIAEGEALSPLQREFNRLAAEADRLKAEIETIKAEIEKARRKVATDLYPLIDELHKEQRNYVFALDQAYGSGYFKKRESKVLARYIAQLAVNIYNSLDEEDDELRALHDKYAETSMDEQEAMNREIGKQFFEAMFGEKINEEEMSADPEAYFQKKQEDFFNAQEAQRAAGRTERHKNKKQLEKEAREQEAQRLEAKDMRSVYTSLAKVLHPDLEPDPQKRTEKEEMMKRVTAAYNNNDFYELLRLQLELALTDRNQLAQMVDEQLNRYISLMRKQVSELNQARNDIKFYSPDAPLVRKYFNYKDRFYQRNFTMHVNKVRDELTIWQQRSLMAQNYERLSAYLREVKEQFKYQDKYGY